MNIDYKDTMSPFIGGIVDKPRRLVKNYKKIDTYHDFTYIQDLDMLYEAMDQFDKFKIINTLASIHRKIDTTNDIPVQDFEEFGMIQVLADLLGNKEMSMFYDNILRFAYKLVISQKLDIVPFSTMDQMINLLDNVMPNLRSPSNALQFLKSIIYYNQDALNMFVENGLGILLSNTAETVDELQIRIIFDILYTIILNPVDNQEQSDFYGQHVLFPILDFVLLEINSDRSHPKHAYKILEFYCSNEDLFGNMQEHIDFAALFNTFERINVESKKNMLKFLISTYNLRIFDSSKFEWECFSSCYTNIPGNDEESKEFRKMLINFYDFAYAIAHIPSIRQSIPINHMIPYLLNLIENSSISVKEHAFNFLTEIIVGTDIQFVPALINAGYISIISQILESPENSQIFYQLVKSLIYLIYYQNDANDETVYVQLQEEEIYQKILSVLSEIPEVLQNSKIIDLLTLFYTISAQFFSHLNPEIIDLFPDIFP